MTCLWPGDRLLISLAIYLKKIPVACSSIQVREMYINSYESFWNLIQVTHLNTQQINLRAYFLKTGLLIFLRKPLLLFWENYETRNSRYNNNNNYYYYY
jgi:hypothetical protein